MTYTIVENFRGFVVTRPPLVVFMICLASFAVALITFAHIVNVKDMPNPDITEDWNTFLKPLSSLDFCVVSSVGTTLNNVSEPLTKPVPRLKDTMKSVQHMLENSPEDVSPSPSTTTTTAPANTDRIKNVTVMLDMELIATSGLHTIASRHNFTFVSTTLQGHQLALTGARKDLTANMTVVFPPLVNQSHQCQHGQCYKQKVCVTLVALDQFFPHTPFPEGTSCTKDIDEGNENHLFLELAPTYLQCNNFSILTLRHQYDPSLTVKLTMHDKSVINLHLMNTSYFLFVMIVAVLCYAIVKGRATRPKVVYTQCAADPDTGNHA